MGICNSICHSDLSCDLNGIHAVHVHVIYMITCMHHSSLFCSCCVQWQPRVISDHRASCTCRSFVGSGKETWGLMALKKAICVRSEGAPTKTGASSVTSQIENSPRSVVGTFSLESCPASWDNTQSIRDQIRDHQNLLRRVNPETRKPESGGFVEATPENLKLNADTLMPVLETMRQHDLQLPSIESLISAINSFYELCKASRSTEQVYQESWGIRRLIGKLKKFIYRPLPPQDCH